MRAAAGLGLLAAALAPARAAAPCPAGGACTPSLLEEVVVTGRRAPGPLMDSSASVSVLSADALARSAVLGLADVLRDVPGIQVTDSGQPGLKRIRIRGEESRRTAVLIDGQEITDHWEVGTPLSLHPAMVERIEVLRGSGSVLYGSRALSGVVNFITRKGGEKPLDMEFSGGYDSATQGHEYFASVFGRLAGTEYRVAAAGANHDDRDTPRGRIPDTGFENSGVYAWAGRDFGAHRVELAYDTYDASTEVFVEEEQRTLFPLIDFRIDVPQRDREKVALFYEWQEPLPALAAVRVNLQHQDNARVFDTFSRTLLPGTAPLDTQRWIRSDAALELDDGVLQLDWRPAAAHYLVSGLQLTEERVNQERHVDTVLNGGAPRPEDIHDEASIRTAALFASDDWDISEATRLNAGVRQYWVEGALDETNRIGLAPSSQNDAQAIGSLGLTHLLNDDTALRLSAAQGYVYPSLLQFATGAYAGSRFVNPNPELDPEHSWSVEGGVRLRRGAWVLDAGVFHTRSEDYIDHVFCTATDGCLSSRDKRYVNIGESEARGLEGYVAREAGAWRPYSSLTWMRRENRYEGFRTEDSGTPALSGSLGVLWQPTAWGAWEAWCDLQLRGETASKREEPSSSGVALTEEDDSWITLNLSGGASFGAARRFTLVLELENLADATYSTSAENLYAPGRSARARLGYRL